MLLLQLRPPLMSLHDDVTQLLQANLTNGLSGQAATGKKQKKQREREARIPHLEVFIESKHCTLMVSHEDILDIFTVDFLLSNAQQHLGLRGIMVNDFLCFSSFKQETYVTTFFN